MFQPLGLSILPSQRQMLRAFLASDPSAEGIFYVAVKTTGVFCRPTCTARKPSVHNVEFFATASDAVHGGYRPCKRCRPMDIVRRPPELVERLREAVERNPSNQGFRRRTLGEQKPRSIDSLSTVSARSDSPRCAMISPM